MQKSFFFLLLSFVIVTGCSDDDPVTPPVVGEVLLAEVSGDSVGVTSGQSSRSLSITSGSLNFTDRDSARITFYYSVENNNYATPFEIYYVTGTTNTNIYTGSNLLVSTITEQFIDFTIPSPRVNDFFQYKITTNSSPGFSFFKFRDLKIYKK